MVKKIAIYYGDKKNEGMYDNGVWMHILGIPFISRIEEAGNYDLIIRTLWLDSTISGWSKEIRTRFPHVTQIGLSDHPLSTHISKLPAPQLLAYLSDLEYLDGVMALTDEEKQFYSVALPGKPVHKVGLPFPFEAYKKKYGNYLDSERKYIGLGVGAADNDRNFGSSWLVFKRLQLQFPELQAVFMSIPDNLLGYCTLLSDYSTNVYIHSRDKDDMGKFYDVLSQCKFVISLADRNTPGRLQGEAAFFGVPVIGSERLELQRELFPDLAVKPYELEKALTLATYILENPEHNFTTYAYNKLSKYNYRASKIRFNKLLKEIDWKV